MTMVKQPQVKIVIYWGKVFTILFRYLWIYVIFPAIVYLIVERYIGDVNDATFIAVILTLFVSSVIGLIINPPRRAKEIDKKNK